MPIVIRQVRPEAADFNAFIGLEQQFSRCYDSLGVGKHYGRVQAEQIPISDHWLEFLNGFRQGSIFIYAEIDGNVCGYLMGLIEEMPTDYRTPNVGFLDSIIVAEDYRGQGVGQALRDHFFAWLKSNSIEFCQLTVKTENHAAITLYQKWGFATDELRMWKKI